MRFAVARGGPRPHRPAARLRRRGRASSRCRGGTSRRASGRRLRCVDLAARARAAGMKVWDPPCPARRLADGGLLVTEIRPRLGELGALKRGTADIELFEGGDAQPGAHHRRQAPLFRLLRHGPRRDPRRQRHPQPGDRRRDDPCAWRRRRAMPPSATSDLRGARGRRRFRRGAPPGLALRHRLRLRPGGGHRCHWRRRWPAASGLPAA